MQIKRRPNFLRGTLALLLLFCCTTLALAVKVQAGPYRLDVVTDPPTIPVGRANLVVTVMDMGGQPVSGATVKAIAKMPGMNMGEKEQPGRPGEAPGMYVVPAVFSMGGLYEATITVEGPAGRGTAVIQLVTGENTSSTGGVDPFSIAVVAVGVCLAIFILWRMRRTGQSINIRSLFTFSVLGSLVLLAGAVVLSLWLIKTQRRPGAMTPIEAQAMEMNTPAPEGVMPVVLATVEERDFAPAVRYSGQAVGFTEQDIVPRTTGVIIEMPVYVGDRVKKGQVLARLDTTQLDPELDMQSAALSRSRQGVEVAALEYEAALTEVATARAELSLAEGEVREAEAMLAAAQEDKERTAADTAGADAEVASAQAAFDSAISNQRFAHSEVERQKALAEKGFVSQKEAQRAKTEADRADADVRQADQSRQKAASALRSAQSAQRRVDVEIEAARIKAQNAKANSRAKEAMVRRSLRMADAAKAKIGQERSKVKESAAGLRGAAAQKGYATIRAETDGVITQRSIAPGQVVSPGQSILRLARSTPIRLQANVPEADLARIRPGGKVTVVPADGGEAIRLKVSSVSPSVEPGARMGVVEAVYQNADQRFVPGQFVAMTVELGASKRALTIPAAAIVRHNKLTFVWLAEGTGTDLSLKRQNITIGSESGEIASVVEGLAKGQRIVVDPGADLRGGMRVVEIDDSDPSDDGLTVVVTERGYDPPSITIPANTPTKLTFIRKTEATCGEEIIFPDLKITKSLPMNTPVTIEIPARPAGSLRFTCGMDMLEGKLVIQ